MSDETLFVVLRPRVAVVEGYGDQPAMFELYWAPDDDAYTARQVARLRMGGELEGARVVHFDGTPVVEEAGP